MIKSTFWRNIRVLRPQNFHIKKCSTEVSSQKSKNPIVIKYSELLQSAQNKHLDSSEVLHFSPYGVIRLDSENTHLAIYNDEPDDDNLTNQNAKVTLDKNAEHSKIKNENWLETQYFPQEEDKSHSIEPVEHKNFSCQSEETETLNIIDKQYMVSENDSIHANPPFFIENKQTSEQGFSLIDSISADTGFQKEFNYELKPNESNLSEDLDKKYQSVRQKVENIEKMRTKQEKRTEHIKSLKEAKKNSIATPEQEKHESVSTAAKAVKIIRDSQKESSKKYLRIINAVPMLHKMTDLEILKLLKGSILYEDDDLVGLSKPYGMKMHEGGSSKKIYHKLEDFLPKLSKMVNTDQLHMVHRLDMFTTGVLLLAKNVNAARVLKSHFAQQKIDKTYTVLVKGFPKLTNGLIDVPIGQNPHRPNHQGVKPDVEGFSNHIVGAKRALTRYEVLASANGVSVIEVNLITGVKHQIRVHMAEVLECSVLGDHKYANRLENKPQILPGDTLHQLEASKSQAKKLPMFLHASKISFPSIKGSGTTYINAKIPPYFITAFKALKLGSSKNRVSQRDLDYIFPHEFDC